MARKVVGKLSREMNRETASYGGSKESGSRTQVRSTRKISAPRYSGLGGVYRDDDEDI